MLLTEVVKDCHSSKKYDLVSVHKFVSFCLLHHTENFSAKLTLLHMSVNNLDRKRIVFQIIETIHGNVGIFQIEVLNVHLFLPSLFIKCLCSRNQEQRLRQT